MPNKLTYEGYCMEPYITEMPASKLGGSCSSTARERSEPWRCLGLTARRLGCCCKDGDLSCRHMDILTPIITGVVK